MSDLTKHSSSLFTSDKTVDIPHLCMHWR